MHLDRFKPLAAALLLSGAAGAHASVNPEIGFSCSDTLSINDLGGLQVGCSGDLRVFGNGPDSVLSHPDAIVLRAGGDVRLGAGLDPNRVTVVTTSPGGVVTTVGFQASASISGSRFDSGARLSEWPSPISGQVSGAFFGPVGTSSGVIDVTSPGLVGASGGGRYVAPFLQSKPVTGTLSPVPEPSTWALLLGGLGLMALASRRRA